MDPRVTASRVLNCVFGNQGNSEKTQEDRHQEYLVSKVNWLMTTFDQLESIPVRVECRHYGNPLVPELILPWTYTIGEFSFDDSRSLAIAFQQVFAEINAKDRLNEYFIRGAYSQYGRGYLLLDIRPKALSVAAVVAK